MHKRKYKRSLLLLAAVLAAVLCLPSSVLAAEGDPTLRFDLTTESAVTGLSAGDQVQVDVHISRDDGSAAPFDLYSILLDVQYDNELLEVTQLKTPGLKRPDGANWIGSWNCNLVPAGGTDKRVRVLYMNIGGLMSSPPNLDRVSGSLEAASFLVTVKKEAPEGTTAVGFYQTESGGSDYKAGPSVVGEQLTLTIGGKGGSGGGSDGSGGSGSGGSSSGSDGDSGSSSGSGGSGSGSGSGGSASGSDSGANGSGGARTKVAFGELTDIDDTHWAAPYIRYLVEQGIVSGNEKKEFEPDKPVTRAEFAQKVVSAFGYERKSSVQRFSDVRAEDWYYQPVMALYQAGVVSGRDDGSFGAEASLSRQDMAVILYQLMQDQNLSLPLVRDYAEFPDQPLVADYAQRALWELYCTGIVSGTGEGTLSPEDPSTRAQVATVLTTILKKVEEGR